MIDLLLTENTLYKCKCGAIFTEEQADFLLCSNQDAKTFIEHDGRIATRHNTSVLVQKSALIKYLRD